MGIQEVIAYVGPKPIAGHRPQVSTRQEAESDRGGRSDLYVVSSKARAMYDAGETQKFDTIRERVRLGYYLKGDVLDQVVDAMAREFRVDNPSKAAV